MGGSRLKGAAALTEELPLENSVGCASPGSTFLLQLRKGDAHVRSSHTRNTPRGSLVAPQKDLPRPLDALPALAGKSTSSLPKPRPLRKHPQGMQLRLISLDPPVDLRAK